MVKSRADYEKDWREGVQNGIGRANNRIDEAINLIHGLETNQIGELKTEMAVIKEKTSRSAIMYGAIAGAIPSIPTACIAIYEMLHR